MSLQVQLWMGDQDLDLTVVETQVCKAPTSKSCSLSDVQEKWNIDGAIM